MDGVVRERGGATSQRQSSATRAEILLTTKMPQVTAVRHQGTLTGTLRDYPDCPILTRSGKKQYRSLLICDWSGFVEPALMQCVPHQLDPAIQTEFAHAVRL